MSAPTPGPDLPERLSSRSSGSISGGITIPLRLHTPGPIPPVDDDDDDEEEDRKSGGTGGNIDPDDEDDLDDEDDDDEADKQWASHRNGSL